MNNEPNKLFDKVIGAIVNCIHKRLKISLNPSQSRWGFQSMLLSASLFLIALAISVYAIRISLFSMTVAPSGLELVFVICGFLTLIFLVLLTLYFLRHQGKDPINNDIETIKNDIALLINKFDTFAEIKSKTTCIKENSNNVDIKTPPSLDLAFDWVKNVLKDQSLSADALETKATTLFSVATVILGLGISAGVLKLHGINLESIIFGGLALASYGFVIGYAFAAMRLRRYETLDNPIEIRKWYWDMKPPQFKIELLAHLEDSYTRNEISLYSKAKATRYLVAATAAEVMFLVMSLAFGL